MIHVKILSEDFCIVIKVKSHLVVSTKWFYRVLGLFMFRVYNEEFMNKKYKKTILKFSRLLLESKVQMKL